MFSAREKRWLCLIAVFYLTALALSVWLHMLPVRDMAHRYIPMAEAFAARDFRFAFHPRIPPLQPLCGGIVAFFTGADGFLALKIASALWSVAGGALFCLLLRETHRDDRWVAAPGTLLYLFFPYMFHMAYSGLRESAKGTILVLLALALVKIRRECRAPVGFLLAGIGAGLAALLRAEFFAMGIFCLFVAGVFECERSRFPWRSAVATLIAAALCFPNILANWLFFRTAMPDVRFAELFLRITGRQAGIGDALLLGAALILLLPVAARAAARPLHRINAGYLWLAAFAATAAVTVFTAMTGRDRGEPGAVIEHLAVIGKSLYYFVTPVALVHIGVRIKKKQFTGEEHAVVLVVGANLLLCVLQGQFFHRTLELSPRYLFPATPLLLGFFILSVRDLYRGFLLFLPRPLVNLMLLAAWIGVAVMYCYHAPQPLFREYHHPRRLAERRFIDETTEIIAGDYRGPGIAAPRRSLWHYSSRRRPMVWFDNTTKITVSACLAGGSLSRSLRDADYAVSVKRPRRKGIRVVGRVSDGHHNYTIWRMR